MQDYALGRDFLIDVLRYALAYGQKSGLDR